MPEPQKYIVGREGAIEVLREFVESKTGEFILNIYGPAGIGKTEVCLKVRAHCQEQSWPHMFVQIDTPNLTFDRVLFRLKDSLFRTIDKPRSSYEFFEEFERHFSEY